MGGTLRASDRGRSALPTCIRKPQTPKPSCLPACCLLPVIIMDWTVSIHLCRQVRQSALCKQVVKAKPSAAPRAAHPAAPCLHLLRAGRRAAPSRCRRNKEEREEDKRRRRRKELTHTTLMRSGLTLTCVATTNLCKQGSKDSAHALANASKFFLLLERPLPKVFLSKQNEWATINALRRPRKRGGGRNHGRCRRHGGGRAQGRGEDHSRAPSR